MVKLGMHVATAPAHPAEGYGYQWWVTTIGKDPAFFALGMGGQLIEVVPRLGLVVVISTEVDEEHPAGPSFMGQLLSYMVRGIIVPAVR